MRSELFVAAPLGLVRGLALTLAALVVRSALPTAFQVRDAVLADRFALTRGDEDRFRPDEHPGANGRRLGHGLGFMHLTDGHVTDGPDMAALVRNRRIAHLRSLLSWLRNARYDGMPHKAVKKN